MTARPAPGHGSRRDLHETNGAVETAGRRAARYLKAGILSGAFPPGSRIQQESVARELGMSRIPVREAMRELEAEGLLVLVAHGTARVSKLDMAESAEIYLMRESLEPLAAREAVARVTDEEVDQLRAIVQAMENLDFREGAWLELDRRFHLATYHPAGLPRLMRTVESFWNTTQPYRRAFNTTLTIAEVTMQKATHLLLVDAFERRDSEAAEQLVRVHIHGTRLRLAQRPELFAPPGAPLVFGPTDLKRPVDGRPGGSDDADGGS